MRQSRFAIGKLKIKKEVKIIICAIKNIIKFWSVEFKFMYRMDKFITNKDYFLRKYKGIDRYIVHEKYSYETFPHTYIQSYKYQKEIDYEPAIMTYEEVDFESRNIK